MVATQAALPIPNPGDWCTCTDARIRLGVSHVTLFRMIRDGRLQAYTIGDQPVGRNTLIWRADLEDFAAARKLAFGG